MEYFTFINNDESDGVTLGKLFYFEPSKICRVHEKC